MGTYLTKFFYNLREEFDLDYENAKKLSQDLIAVAAVASHNNPQYSNFLMALKDILKNKSMIKAEVYWPVLGEVKEEVEFGKIEFIKIDSDFRMRKFNNEHFHFHGQHREEDPHTDYLELYNYFGFFKTEVEYRAFMEHAKEVFLESPIPQELYKEIENGSSVEDISDVKRAANKIWDKIHRTISSSIIEKTAERTSLYNSVFDLIESDFMGTLIEPQKISFPFPVLITYAKEDVIFDDELCDEFIYYEGIDRNKPGIEIIIEKNKITPLSSDLQKEFDSILKGEEKDEYMKKLRQAIEWYNKIENNYQMDVIIYRIILEILFTTKQSKSYVIKRRAFRLMTELFDEENDLSIKQSLDTLKRVRNGIIHEGKRAIEGIKDKKDISDLDEAMGIIDFITKFSI